MCELANQSPEIVLANQAQYTHFELVPPLYKHRACLTGEILFRRFATARLLSEEGRMRTGTCKDERHMGGPLDHHA
jgi:hypothetical protein